MRLFRRPTGAVQAPCWWVEVGLRSTGGYDSMPVAASSKRAAQRIAYNHDDVDWVGDAWPDDFDG